MSCWKLDHWHAFVNVCVDPKPGLFCVSTSHVPPWKLVTLQPCAADDAECDVEVRTDVWGNPGDSNELASMLDVGDNFAVKADSADEEGASFYIVQCFKRLHVVNKDARTRSIWSQSGPR